MRGRFPADTKNEKPQVLKHLGQSFRGTVGNRYAPTIRHGDCLWQVQNRANRRGVSPAWTQAPAHRRLRGYILHRIRSAPSSIWIRVDLGDFCEFTGLSLRSARYALNRIRDTQDDHGLRFRTLWKHRRGRRGHWQVLASSTEQLRFDCEPLFRSNDGRERHVRPSLRESEIIPDHRPRELSARAGSGYPEGEGTTPPIPAQKGRERVCFTTNEAKPHDLLTPSQARYQAALRPERECNPYRGGYFVTSRHPDKHPPGGGGSNRWRAGKEISRAGQHRLRRKAGAITRRLGNLWWDNAKVADPSTDREARNGLMGFVTGALAGGFTEREIEGATDQALHQLHGTATDRGEVFDVSSTITRARRILSRDKRTREERVVAFYDDRRRERELILRAISETIPG